MEYFMALDEQWVEHSILYSAENESDTWLEDLSRLWEVFVAKRRENEINEETEGSSTSYGVSLDDPTNVEGQNKEGKITKNVDEIIDRDIGGDYTPIKTNMFQHLSNLFSKCPKKQYLLTINEQWEEHSILFSAENQNDALLKNLGRLWEVYVLKIRENEMEVHSEGSSIRYNVQSSDSKIRDQKDQNSDDVSSLMHANEANDITDSGIDSLNNLYPVVEEIETGFLCKNREINADIMDSSNQENVKPHNVYDCKVMIEKFNLVTKLGKETYKCNICERVVTDRSGRLTNHLSVHTGKIIHKCHICNKRFSSSGGLINHKKIHKGDKSFKCKFCGKSFFSSQKLERHSFVHGGIKPHKCEICGHRYADVGNLNKHLIVHSGVKPYSCQICGKKFNTSSYLLVHTRTHQGVKLYQCDVCNKSFANSSNLRTHKRVLSGEKPYKCDVCSMSFSVNGNLQAHKRIHSGEKPYKCVECGKAFTGNGALTIHSRSHSGEKPYKCEYCDKRFSINSNLNRHIKETHRL